MQIKQKNFYLTAKIALIIIVLDQATKYYLLHVYGLYGLHAVSSIQITEFFNLVAVWNSGVSFGMFAGHGKIGIYLINLVAMAIIGILLYWLKDCDKKSEYLAGGLIVGGAFGNIIDRILYGAVFDFLDFHLFNFHWYAFNIADASIFCGVMLIFCLTLRK